MRLVFAGTPDIAVPYLSALHHSSHEVTAVYSQPDRPRGRGRKLTPSPVKAYAQTVGLPIYQPLNFKSDKACDELRAQKPDVMVVVAYGLILPQKILDIPHFGCINVHASLLPKWRGAAPIQRAILAGDNETGVTIMQMDKGMDTGDMLSVAKTPIDSLETAASLHDKLATLGINPLLEVLKRVEEGALAPQKQDPSFATHAAKITKEDAIINWANDADFIARQTRAFYPQIVAYTLYQGEKIRIHEASCVESSSESKSLGEIIDVSRDGVTVACGKGVLLIKKVQLAGGKALSIADVLNGKPNLFVSGHSFEF